MAPQPPITNNNPATPSPLRSSQTQQILDPQSVGSNMPLMNTQSQDFANSTPGTTGGIAGDMASRPPAITRLSAEQVAGDMHPRPPAVSRFSSEQIHGSPSPLRRVGTGGNEMTFWNPTPQYPPSARQSIEMRQDATDFPAYGEGPHLFPAEQQQQLFDDQPIPSALPQQRRWTSTSQQRPHLRQQKPSSMRSTRFDPRRNSYRHDMLSDIDSASQQSGLRDGGPRDALSRLSGYQYRRESTPQEDVLRLPLTWWMNSDAKNHFVAMIGEFIGTTMFLFFAFAGTQVANIGAGTTTSTTNSDNGFSPIVLLYIAVSFGFSLMVNVWIFFRISGGLFNPAVTLAMTMVKSINYVRAVHLLIAQISGSLLASVLVRALFPTPLNVRTTLSAETSLVRGVFIEALLTAELVFSIFMLAKEKHKATFMAPVGIGLALFVAELVGVYYTGGSLNPARSFGPCAITGVWDSEHWVYWLGPAIGAVLAVCFYRLIKILEYEVANPGQDARHEKEEKLEAHHMSLPRHMRSKEDV